MIKESNSHPILTYRDIIKDLTPLEQESGRIIYADKTFVVRLQRGGGEITLNVHQVDDGVEMRPLGYMMGSNRLTCLLDKSI